LLIFEIKNKNLTSDQAKLFQDRFGETKELLQKNPDDFDQWLYLGVLKKGAGDYEGSRDVFLYVGQIRPRNSISFANLADLYTYFLNEPQKAEVAIKKAIANDPNNFNFYLTLVDIYRYKFPDGEKKYESVLLDALDKFPENSNIIAPLASYYRQTNQVAKAIQYYEELVQLVPENQTAKQDLAELKAKQ
jgi:cytochrome c-type biogenesis protein CcmH/NrfG